MFRVLLYIKILFKLLWNPIKGSSQLQVFFNEVGFPSPLVKDKGLFEFSKVFLELSPNFEWCFFYSLVMWGQTLVGSVSVLYG